MSRQSPQGSESGSTERSSPPEPPPLRRKRFIDLPPSPANIQLELSPLPKTGSLPQLPEANLAIECHDVLRSSHEMGTSERILWDMRFSWNRARLRSTNNTISTIPHHILTSSATLPVSRTISIICPALPWRLTVPAKREVWEAYVTVQEVLEALDQYLHTSVTTAELASICTGQSHMLRSIHSARATRLLVSAGQAVPGSDAEVLRVDVLREDTTFAGLKPLANNEHFILELTPTYVNC